MVRCIAILTTALLLSSCASRPASDSTSISAASTVEVSDILPMNATVIGTVRAIACGKDKNQALAKARLQAQAMGATHITDVTYGKSGVNAVEGCWYGNTVKALAYR